MWLTRRFLIRASKDRINTRILQTKISGIPPCTGLMFMWSFGPVDSMAMVFRLFLLVFGLPPLVHPDDPARAVLASMELVQAAVVACNCWVAVQQLCLSYHDRYMHIYIYIYIYEFIHRTFMYTYIYIYILIRQQGFLIMVT